MGLWSRKSIFILARSSSCSIRDGSGHHNWSWRSTWMTLIAPNKHSENPSYRNWSTSFIIILISTIFQNMKYFKRKRKWFITLTYFRKPHFVLQISRPHKIAKKWFCIHNLRLDLSFQEKKTVCNSVAWFTSYNSSRDMAEFLRFF